MKLLRNLACAIPDPDIPTRYKFKDVKPIQYTRKLESFNEIYHIIKKENLINGIFHCFSGTKDQANKIIDMGFLLGIGGISTFKNSNMDSVLKEIDIKNLVLETDSPYLAPTPFRGKRNEPKYLVFIAEKICKLKNISLDELAYQTNQNIDRVFF